MSPAAGTAPSAAIAAGEVEAKALAWSGSPRKAGSIHRRNGAITSRYSEHDREFDGDLQRVDGSGYGHDGERYADEDNQAAESEVQVIRDIGPRWNFASHKVDAAEVTPAA